jgi:hypothetical protein
MKPHLKKTLYLRILNVREFFEFLLRRPTVATATLHYRVNAGLTFEPWMNVWQVTQGTTVVEPGSRPCTPPADSGLWHWLHSVETDGMFSSRGFCVP